MRSASLVFLLLRLLAAPAFAAGPPPPAVALQPLGRFDEQRIEELRQGVEQLYAVKVVVLPARPLPTEAFYPPRQRYRADRLLDDLESRTEAEYVKVVGLTQVDISTTKGEHKDWGIFGLGSIGGRACVVSTFRLGRGRVGEPKLRERLVKVVLHELGHTFGRPHCPAIGCLMEDAKGSIATVDREAKQFCEACTAFLGAVLHKP